MTNHQFIRSIKIDAQQYPSSLYRSPGFWVTLSYRIRRYRKIHCKSFFIRLLLIPVDIFFGLIRSFFAPMRLPSSVEIGPGLYLPHPEGIYINDKAHIGSNVTIFQHVTLGEWRGKAPKVSDGVSIYAGAKVFGGIVLGENAQIGANAVANTDVPANRVLALSRSAMVLLDRSE